MIPAAVSGVLFTSLAAAVGRGDQSSASRHIQDATRLSLGMLVPAWVLLSVDSSSVMALLFGSAYADGGILLSLLCLAFLFSALLDLWLHAISADGSVAISALVTASLVPVLWLANRYMIEAGGAIGAARATVAVFSLGALLAAGLTARKFGKVVKWLSVLRIGAAGVTIWFIGSLLPPAGPWVVAKLAVLGLVYLAVLGLSGEITKQEIVSLVQGTLGTK
jgi:O-antigen/teichoic acid export membrane protein